MPVEANARRHVITNGESFSQPGMALGHIAERQC